MTLPSPQTTAAAVSSQLLSMPSTNHCPGVSAEYIFMPVALAVADVADVITLPATNSSALESLFALGAELKRVVSVLLVCPQDTLGSGSAQQLLQP
jgi:hypothetical protein